MLAAEAAFQTRNDEQTYLLATATIASTPAKLTQADWLARLITGVQCCEVNHFVCSIYLSKSERDLGSDLGSSSGLNSDPYPDLER